MAELQDIETYLLEHPEDHAQRWRLTKKLYMACEYRDALSHLLILKREAEWKLNHSRYLAATYYRLGRYDEAVSELQEAVRAWPYELSIREQMARAHEVAGRSGDAVRVWQEILAIDPQHPIAAQSVQRLSEAPADASPEQELRLHDSDSGIDLAAGIACPKCGARNSLDFDRCWQCHALLGAPGTPTPEIRKRVPAQTSDRFWMVVIGFATVGLLSAGVHKTLSYAANRPLSENGFIVADSVDALLHHEWFVARLATGGTLLVAWPAILWLAALTCCDRTVRFRYIAGVSLPAAALLYVLLWLPVRMMPLAVILPTLLTLLAIPLTFPVTLFRALIAWAVQLVLVLLCGFGIFAGTANIATLNHLDALFELDAIRAAEIPDGVYTMTSEQLPAEWTVTWSDTGSDWVNSAGRRVEFTIMLEAPDGQLTVEFLELGHTRVYREREAPPVAFTYEIAPERSYALRIRGSGTGPVHVTVTGLLLPRATGNPR